MASSKLVGELEMISVTRATAMATTLVRRTPAQPFIMAFFAWGAMIA
jgi:hypothetical protein